jgi:hypothetical protein
MVNLTNKVFRHPTAGRLYPGRDFTANEISYPANWLELATEADLAAHNITVSYDIAITDADRVQEEKYQQRELLRREQIDVIHLALGRYLDEFEQTIFNIRRECVALTSLLHEPSNHLIQQRLMQVVFNHRGMTADNLFRIYEGLVGEIVNDQQMKISNETKEAIVGSLRSVNKLFNDMTETRNNFVHGTWFIGWGNSATSDWSEASLLRVSVKQAGAEHTLRLIDPKAIDACTIKCKETNSLFMLFGTCLKFEIVGHNPGAMLRNFEKVRNNKNYQWVPKSK